MDNLWGLILDFKGKFISFSMEYINFIAFVIIALVLTIIFLFIVGLREGTGSSTYIKKSDLRYHQSSLKLWSLGPIILGLVLLLWISLWLLPTMNTPVFGFGFILFAAGFYSIGAELILVNIGVYGYILGFNLSVSKSSKINIEPIKIKDYDREAAMSNALNELKMLRREKDLRERNYKK